MRLQNTAVMILLLGFFLVPDQSGAEQKKRAGEACTEDQECKGHCYQTQRQGKKCVDCSANTIEGTRREISNAKKVEKRCPQCQYKGNQEHNEQMYKQSIDGFKNLLEWRKKENDACWDGGDSAHDDGSNAITEAEAGKNNCERTLSDCKGYGLIYTCSESTYDSKKSDVDSSCASEQDKICDRWQSDGNKVDCRAIEEAMSATRKCVSAVDSLKSSCLDRFSSWRERQRELANRGYDKCKAILENKQNNNLCN